MDWQLLEGISMKWVTRRRVHVNRTATVWLVRRLLDPRAEIRFVEPDEVAAVQERDGALGFDAPGARYPHSDGQGRCSFEQLVDERPAFLYDSLYAHLRRRAGDPEKPANPKAAASPQGAADPETPAPPATS